MEIYKTALRPAWYVLHTKSRAESAVHNQLTIKRIEAFLPKILVASRRKDRRQMLRLPLFPGYLFVKTDLAPRHHLEIVKTMGAVKLVGGAGGPIPVPDETVQSLNIMVAGDAPVATGVAFQRGDQVMVLAGPFSGVVGIFDHYRGRGRVIVYIEALGRFAAVEVEEADVERVAQLRITT